MTRQSPSVRRFSDAAAFRVHAGEWLLAAEAENHLLLGIVAELEAGSSRRREPAYLACVEDDGDILGCAFRTPPFKLGITRLDDRAISPLVADVASVYSTLPAVLGPRASTAAFARAWGRARGVVVQPGMEQAIHELRALVEPTRATRGERRRARPNELSLTTAWARAFLEESEVEGHGVAQACERWIEEGLLHLWQDPGPVSMAAVVGRSAGAARIGFVYTPPAHRAHGYATALVAGMSRDLLNSGLAVCLYTDLANPTSNGIYARLGYQRVADVLEIALDGATDGKRRPSL